MRTWLETWGTGTPPHLPGLVAFADSARLERILFIGACAGSMAEESQNFECKFGNVSELVEMFAPEYKVLFWATPHDPAIVGQLPNLVEKIVEELRPTINQQIGKKALKPAKITTLEEELI